MIALVIFIGACMVVRETVQDLAWRFRSDGTDPPSFRRWQERQRRRDARRAARKPITDRQEGRRFMAHWWHDAWETAHERRGRIHQKRADDRRRRWQAEDVDREKQQSLAQCVFCGAGQGKDCATDCPERQAHDTNRATGGRATVPPVTASTEPTLRTEPSQPGPTVPSEPSHADTTEPSAPSQPPVAPSGEIDQDDPFTASVVHDSDEYIVTPGSNTPRFHRTEPGPIFNSLDELTAWADTQQCAHCGAKGQLRNGGFDENGRYNLDIYHAADCPNVHANASGSTTDDLARKRAEKSTTTGGNVTGSTATGEITGYESTLAEMDQTLAHLEAVHADADRKVHTFEQLDAVYENRINALRSANADAETIGTQVAAREANETQISAAKAALEAASVHLEAENAARARWVGGIGAMKETADATGAEGDRVLRS